MLWYKSWLETRWRFLAGLAVLILSASATVVFYPEVLKLLPAASKLEFRGEIGRRVNESVALASNYRGYIWSQFFLQNMPQMWALFAALIGTGGLLAQSAGGGALFTLSLPATRNRLVGVRAATGLAELLVLAIAPVLLLPVLSPMVGESYGLGEALLHGTWLFLAGAVYFCLAFLLSTVFTDIWRPFLIVACLIFFDQILRAASPISLFGLMSAEGHFRGVGLPWLGLLASMTASAALLYAASRNIARQDF
jgi:hypothetical protein